MDTSLELQGKVVEAMKAANVAGGRVYDLPPPDAMKPYVSIGPWTSTSDDADCIDTDEISAQIDVWSDKPGYPEVKSIAGAIRAALDEADLSLSDNALASFEHRITRYMRDADGLTSRAVITFTALIERA